MQNTATSYRLRHLVSLQTRSTAQDSSGGQVNTWADWATGVYAEILPITGRELFAAQAVQQSVSHTVILRYRPGVNAAMRLVFGSRLFNINSVIDPEERRRWLSLTCDELLNQG